MRANLAGRYNTVRPFLALLGESAALCAAPGGERVLAAVRGLLPELARRRVAQKPLTAAEIDAELGDAGLGASRIRECRPAGWCGGS